MGRHSLQKGLREHCPEIADILRANACEVALLDVIEDAVVRCWKAGRLHIGVVEIEDRFALQRLL